MEYWWAAVWCRHACMSVRTRTRAPALSLSYVLNIPKPHINEYPLWMDKWTMKSIQSRQTKRACNFAQQYKLNQQWPKKLKMPLRKLARLRVLFTSHTASLELQIHFAFFSPYLRRCISLFKYAEWISNYFFCKPFQRTIECKFQVIFHRFFVLFSLSFSFSVRALFSLYTFFFIYISVSLPTFLVM